MLRAQKCTQPGKQSNDCNCACVYTSTTSFQLLSCGGTTHTNRLLQECVDTHSSGKTYQEEDKGSKGQVKE